MISIEKQYNSITDKQFADNYQQLIQKYENEYYSDSYTNKHLFIINKLRMQNNIHYLIWYMFQNYKDISKHITNDEIIDIICDIFKLLDNNDILYIYNMPYNLIGCLCVYSYIEKLDDMIINFYNQYTILYVSFHMLCEYYLLHYSHRSLRMIQAYCNNFQSIDNKYKYQFLNTIKQKVYKLNNDTFINYLQPYFDLIKWDINE